MMFSNLFHTTLTDDGFISISVRSSENRSDQFLFTKEEIKPALDDDPTDDCWSGSSVFQMKRQKRRGGIRIWNGDHWTFWVVSRQDVELMNAHLYNLCEDAFGVREDNNSIREVENSIVETLVQSSPVDVSDELIARIKDVVQVEIRQGFANLMSQLENVKIAQSQSNVVSQTTQRPKIEPAAKPTAEFIPSDLSNGMIGSIKQKTEEKKSNKALDAAKKLRGFKK